jgi:hypothetical protein
MSNRKMKKGDYMLNPNEHICPMCGGVSKVKGELYCKESCRKKANLLSKYCKLYSVGGGS